MNIKNLRLFVIILMMIVGILSIIISLLNKNQNNELSIAYSIVSVGGGALFGGALTMLIENLMGSEITDIRNYLLKNEKFESAPDYLDVVSGKWHVYYLTKSNSSRKWNYTIYNITKDSNTNTLTGYYNVIDLQGNSREYKLECGLRGSSLILFSNPNEGTEFSAIEIVPKAISTHLPMHISIGLLETWDGELAISYAIYSRKKLINRDNLSNEDYTLLDDYLNEAMTNQKLINLK